MIFVEYDEVDIKNIEVDPRYTTRHSDIDKDIDQLTDSIKTIGLLQPIGLLCVKYKKYKLIFGQRRFLACKKLKYKKIPSMVYA